jgi:hypothetical protein
MTYDIHIPSKIRNWLSGSNFPVRHNSLEGGNEKVCWKTAGTGTVINMCRVSVRLTSPALVDSGFWGGLRPNDFVEGVTERIEILEA